MFAPTDYDGSRSVRARVALPEPEPVPEPADAHEQAEREWRGMEANDNLPRLRALGISPGLREHAELGRWDLVELGLETLIE